METLGGWLGPEVAQAEYSRLCGDMPLYCSTPVFNDYRGKRSMLWEHVRKVLGSDTPNYAQEIGDCVSFGGKNVLEYLQCVEISAGEAEEFHPIYPPYFYGTSRVLVGGGRVWGDGSTGVWLQQAVKQYGVLRADEAGVPAYAGSIARQWGNQGPPQDFVKKAQDHLVLTTAKCLSAEDVANALLSGYPVAVCSNWGFRMNAGSDGFHQPSGSWGHCMTIIGFEDHPQYGLYFIILNSWADVHGRLKDFQTGADLPIGCLRVRGEYVDKMAQQGDTFAYSQFNGFPDQSDKIAKALYDVVGD